MSANPIHCNNCLSQKREFFVYLQCKHFICMSCCLFMANLQTLTIRCCHRQTRMSQQLVRTIFEEIQARKALMEMGEITIDSVMRDFSPKIDSNQLITSKVKEVLKSNVPDVVFKRTKEEITQNKRVLGNLLKSKESQDSTDKNGKQHQSSKQKLRQKSREKAHHLTQIAKLIELQQSQVEKDSRSGKIKKSIEKRNQRQKQQNIEQKGEKKIEKRKQIFSKPPQLTEQFDPMQYSVMKSAARNNFQTEFHQQTEARRESPTFKQLKLNNSDPKPSRCINEFFSSQQAKKNYQYWKNYDSTKDRILAKLNHHQYKMKSLIKEHYYG